MAKDYDFSGWATKANLKCSDGRIIRPNAFEHCDGIKVPLVWNHRHNSPEEVLGHALLENRAEGVYAYCYFNDTDSAQAAKICVQHGDINQLSIYANKLKQQGCNVIHGMIREVSLVHCGANPGAYIDSVISHGDDSYEEGEIFTGEDFDYVKPISHADSSDKETAKETEGKKEKSEKTIKEILDTLNEEQAQAVYAIVGQILNDANKKSESSENKVEHSGDDDNEKTIDDVLAELTEEQRNVVYGIIGMLMEEKENNPNNEKVGGTNEMKHNVFDQDTKADVLSHAEMMGIMEDAKRLGSLRESVLQHGIEDIEYLFPDARNVETVPGFIKRDDTWVAEFMKSVHHTPFARIKSIHADITEADARAKGYLKGNYKTEEFFTLLKRITNPTTVYKKQSLDRDDVVDIVDFDTVAWIKSEMRMMLDEELARAALVGDGRSSSSNDKINEQHIRPIWTDDDIYTIKQAIEVKTGMTDDEKAKAFIRATIKSRKKYKGSGNPTMFITEDMLTNCLLLEDANGRMIYDTIEKLATALRVKKIVPVPVMENLTRIVGANTHELAGIYVNLNDYNIGADKGGAVNLFDDFDIDYNKMKYLIETRCSGALTLPFSAAAIEFVSATV